jgi:membrane protein
LVPKVLEIGALRPQWSRWRPTLHYLMETEAHVYALAVSASVLLAFFPFLVVMTSFCRDVLHWPAAEKAVYLALGDFYAGAPGPFFVSNLRAYFVLHPGKFHFMTMLLLLFTANGVFEPLEVALNRAWGVTENRPYWKNQLVSLGMIFICGGLAIVSLMLTALNTEWMGDWVGHGTLASWISQFAFKVAAVPISIMALFLVYWRLPNRKVDPARVAPVALWVGIALEGLKYVNILLAPWLAAKFEQEYFIFKFSVTILIWSFIAALIVLAGAHWTARHEQQDPLSREHI